MEIGALGIRGVCVLRSWCSLLMAGPMLLAAGLALAHVVVGCKPARTPALISSGPKADAGAGGGEGGPAPLADARPGGCAVSSYQGVNALPANAAYLQGTGGQSGSQTSACVAAVPGLLSGSIQDVPMITERMFLSMPSPNANSRNGQPISGIVVHHTYGGFAGAVATLRNPNPPCPRNGDPCPSPVSAHLVVSRTGQIARLVPDELSAFHAVQVNRSTLGVEIEATEQARGLTPAQERALLAIMFFWFKKHRLGPQQITTHRTHVPTECPSFIWPSETIFSSWRDGVGVLSRRLLR